MEWERTKTILITSFLVLNIFFVVQIWIVPSFLSASLYTSSEEIKATVSKLEERGISIETEIPRQLQRLSMIQFQLPEIEARQVAEKLLGPEAVHVSTAVHPAPGHNLFRRTYREVTVYNDGRISYQNTGIGVQPGGSKESALQVAEEFINSTLGMPRDAQLVEIVRHQGIWWVEFRQVWRHHDLHTSYLVFQISGDKVMSMDMYWLHPASSTGRKTLSIPATGALLVVADNLMPTTEIKEIYISWYSPPMMAETWRVPPVWVVETTAGERYYINAFTGELEAVQEFPPLR